MQTKLYSQLAQLILARENCKRDNKLDWLSKHTDTIRKLVKEHMPSGSGFDCGTKLDLDESTVEKLVLFTEFHHMDDAGGLDGWTEHTIVVKPSLAFGFTIRITGKNKRDIKDYMHEVFATALNTEV